MNRMLKNHLIILYILLSSMVLQASDVDKLLKDFTKKNASSQKTIDENKGHLVLYTRERLEKMHAKTLKDVFKTTPVVYYNENRYALPDSLSSGLFEPYRSNFIRLYIDGVETTQGWLGSGLALYGDMNINFVDHIEFYYLTPSFESSTEPAYLTVFLYSKTPDKDSGAELNLAAGTRGYNTQTINYGEQKEDYAYMVNFSHTNAKRETIDNGTDVPLSRDFERTQLFSYIKTDNQIFHLQVMKKNTDSLAGLSLDATPLVSEIDHLNVHMDYGIDFSEQWSAQFTYEWLNSDIRQQDDTPLFFAGEALEPSIDAKLKTSTYNAELTYEDTIGDHKVTTGFKGRIKQLNGLSRSLTNNVEEPFDRETILTTFFQDQYALNEFELLTFGLSYNKIYRNGNTHDDDLYHFRLGYIFAGEEWSYKTYLYRTMYSLDPLSRRAGMTSDTGMISDNRIEPQKTLGITQEVSYTQDDYRVRMMFLLMKDEDGLLEDAGEGNTKYFFSVLNYDYDFDLDNKMNLQLYYALYDDIFNLDKLEDFSGFLSFMNTYESFDFYNAVVWHQNNIDYVHYFDVTSSISWNASENLTLTLKGENLLDKAKASNLFRINPSNGSLLAPLNISPIDQRVMLELEYTF